MDLCELTCKVPITEEECTDDSFLSMNNTEVQNPQHKLDDRC